MSSNETKLARATLTPFDEGGDKLLEDKALELDFNPESLTLEVSNSLEEANGRSTRQTVRDTVSTLSFDAVFDSTRPRADRDDDRELDVRKRTERLVALLDVSDKGESPRPARVEFVWGSIVFEGVFEKYSETLDFFSPEGIPLRSKLSITLTEQRYQYDFGDSEASRRSSRDADPSQQESSQSDEAQDESLFERDEPQHRESRDRAGDQQEAGSFADKTRGAGNEARSQARRLGIDVANEVNQTLDLPVDASTALSVLGSDALIRAVGSGVDLGSTGLLPIRSTSPRDSRATRWAPDGPRPGTKEAAVASEIAQRRAQGVESMKNAHDTPVPIKGSPPRHQPKLGAPTRAALFRRRSASSSRADRSGSAPRPPWESQSAHQRHRQSEEYKHGHDRRGRHGSCCRRCGAKAPKRHQRRCRCSQGDST